MSAFGWSKATDFLDTGFVQTGAGGNTTVTNTTVSNNLDGGIIVASNMTVTNSTVSGNSSSNQAGGFYVSEGTLTIANSTVSNNSIVAGPAGGIFIEPNFGAVVNARNTIIAGNTGQVGSPDIAGTLSSNGYNLIGNTTGTTITGTTTGNQLKCKSTPRPAAE